jgi:sugar/nucleoside kinase (ribokinase family)
VGVVGSDFDPGDIAFLKRRDIDIAGLEQVAGGKTFRWSGEYAVDMNSRQTLSVELNVLEDFEPKIPESFRDSRYVFLANASPVTQLRVLEQVERPEFVMADTMDLWIQVAHKDLLALLQRIDGLVLNDSEALLLTDCRNVLEAGSAILDLGPSRVVIKKGEHGALFFSREGRMPRIVPLPAYPVRGVRDPTGAGDSFAGALMGSIARRREVHDSAFKEALAHGVVVASFTVEDFGVARVADLSGEEVAARMAEYRGLLAI